MRNLDPASDLNGSRREFLLGAAAFAAAAGVPGLRAHRILKEIP
jgi:hypothetical protein